MKPLLLTAVLLAVTATSVASAQFSRSAEGSDWSSSDNRNQVVCSTFSKQSTCEAGGCTWEGQSSTMGVCAESQQTTATTQAAVTPTPSAACTTIVSQENCEREAGCSWTEINGATGVCGFSTTIVSETAIQTTTTEAGVTTTPIPTTTTDTAVPATTTTVPTTTETPDCHNQGFTNATCHEAQFEGNEYKRCRWVHNECWLDECSVKSWSQSACNNASYCQYELTLSPPCQYIITTTAAADTTTTTTTVMEQTTTTVATTTAATAEESSSSPTTTTEILPTTSPTSTTAAPEPACWNSGLDTEGDCLAHRFASNPMRRCRWVMVQGTGVCETNECSMKNEPNCELASYCSYDREAVPPCDYNTATTTDIPTTTPDFPPTTTTDVPQPTQEHELCSTSGLNTRAACLGFRWYNPLGRCRWSSEWNECWFNGCSVKNEEFCSRNDNECTWNETAGVCDWTGPNPTDTPAGPPNPCHNKGAATCALATHCTFSTSTQRCKFHPDCNSFGSNATGCVQEPFNLFCEFITGSGCRSKQGGNNNNQSTGPPVCSEFSGRNQCQQHSDVCRWKPAAPGTDGNGQCEQILPETTTTTTDAIITTITSDIAPTTTEVVPTTGSNQQDDTTTISVAPIDTTTEEPIVTTTSVDIGTTTTDMPSSTTTLPPTLYPFIPGFSQCSQPYWQTENTCTNAPSASLFCRWTGETNGCVNCIKVKPVMDYTSDRIYPSQKFNARLSAKLQLCNGTEQDLPVSFVWEVKINNVVQEGLGFTTRNGGSEFEIPRNTLAADTTYVIYVRATIQGFFGLQFSKTETIRVTVIEDLPTVVIAGGNREVSSKEFQLLARITDPEVVDGKKIDPEKVSWSCVSEGCPAPLQSIPSGIMVTLKDIPAGVFIFKCIYKKAWNKVTITVKSTPVLGIQLQPSTKEGKSHLTTDTLRISAFLDSTTLTTGGTAAGAEPSFSWTVNSQKIASTSKTLVFLPSLISTFIANKPDVKSLTFACTATLNGVTGTATVTIQLMRPITPGTCSVSRLDISTGAVSSSGFVAGESTAIISADNWPTVEGLYYRWMFVSASGRQVPISNLATSLNKSPPKIVPLVSASTLKFVVVGIVDGRPVGSTTCQISVAQPSDIGAVTRTQLEAMKRAASSGNSAEVLNAASIAAAGSNSGTDAEKAANRLEIMSSLKGQFANKSKSDERMSTEEKLSTVDIMTTMLGVGKSQRILGTEASDVKDILNSILTVGTGEDFDSEALAGPTLDIVASLRGTDDAAVIEKTRKLAQLSAQQLGSGEKQVTKNDAFSMTAEKRPAADAIGSVMSTEKTKVLLSSAVLDALGPNVGSATPLALQTIEYDKSPVDAPFGKALASSPVELDLSVGNELANIFGLTKPIEMRFKAHEIILNGTRRPSCNFLNKSATNKEDWFWSDEGVTVGPLDIAAGEVVCYTTHFSMFAAMTEDDDAVESGDIPTTDEDSSVGVVIGVCAGGFLVIALGAGFIVTRNKKGLEDSNSKDRNLEEGTGENDQPLLRTVDNHSQEEEIEMRQTRHARNPI